MVGDELDDAGEEVEVELARLCGTQSLDRDEDESMSK